MDIEYRVNQSISSEQYIELLKKTTLGERRPIEDQTCIQGMIDQCNLMITAWAEDTLVGAARSLTDFHFCCYLSDLAVSESFQKKGIGKALIRKTFESLKPGCKVILLSAPQATEYYPKIGFAPRENCWIMKSVEELK